MKCDYCDKKIEFEYFVCEASNEVWCSHECVIHNNKGDGYSEEEIDVMFEDGIICWTTT